MSASLTTFGDIYVHGTKGIRVRETRADSGSCIVCTTNDGKEVSVNIWDISLYDLQHAIEKALHEEDEGYSI